MSLEVVHRSLAEEGFAVARAVLTEAECVGQALLAPR